MTYAVSTERPEWSAFPNRTIVPVLAALGLLSGCASTIEVPREVRVPVPVPCVERAPEKPALMADEELLALDDYGLVIALARDRRLRQGYISELEATVEGCR